MDKAQKQRSNIVLYREKKDGEHYIRIELSLIHIYVAAHHVEIAVAMRGKLLEALDVDLRFGMKPGKDAAGQQILFIGDHFRRVAGCGVALRLEG